jgi:hypothetical protein
MQDIELKVELSEAVAIVNMLGQLPTSSNAHGLWLKLREQVEPHLPKDDAPKQ